MLLPVFTTGMLSSTCLCSKQHCDVMESLITTSNYREGEIDAEDF